MNGSGGGEAPDERIESWLCAYDEAVAAGAAPGPPAGPEVPPGLRDRLRRAAECVDLLNRHWPRAGLGHASTDDFNVPPGHLADADTRPIAGMAEGPFVDSGTVAWSGPLGGAAPSAADPLGFRLPGFQILEEVGRGGMGIVYRAIQVSLNREVAVKVLPPHLAQDRSRLRRFRNEAHVAARLTEAGILPVHDVLEFGGVPLLVMPYVDGSDLGRVIADRRAALRGEPVDAGLRHPWASLPAEEFLANVFSVLDRVVDAVAVLHQADIIHRDVKPSNVLVDKRGNVWLTDFGLARLGGDSTLTNAGAQLGSPGYMSPEQWEGLDDLDARTDVFGLGVTIYHALTLQLPYGTARLDSRTALTRGPRALRSSLRADYDAVVVKALEPDRRKRYGSGVEMRDDWRRVRDGLFPLARRVGPVRRLGRRVLHHAWGVSDALTVIVMAAALSLAWRGRSTPPTPATAPPRNTRTVVLTTQPPGARAVLVPIDGVTGDLRPARAVRPPAGARTPVRLAGVPPGDYLVVTELPRGDFHEVFRHVPEPGDLPKLDRARARGFKEAVFPHHSWTEEKDGSIGLPTVVIPTADRSGEMARFPGSPEFLVGDDSIGLSEHPVRVEPFELDTVEVTIGAYQGVIGELPETFWTAGGSLDADAPVVYVTWNQAAAYAEKVGKRLPTEEEYEFAATGGGSTKYPWGNERERSEGGAARPWRFPSVGRADEPDRTTTSPPVLGLYSSVAEWTSSWPKPYEPSAALRKRFPNRTTPRVRPYDDKRVVRGGPPDVLKGVEPGAKDAALLGPRFRQMAAIEERLPGLGFRCARSVRPRHLDP